MSGNTDGELMQAAKDAGLSLLHKPVRPAKLRSLLRNLALPTPN
jgi:two-component system, sensor histidine kinase